jgi:hypothetical protein
LETIRFPTVRQTLSIKPIGGTHPRIARELSFARRDALFVAPPPRARRLPPLCRLQLFLDAIWDCYGGESMLITSGA